LYTINEPHFGQLAIMVPHLSLKLALLLLL
jgi:hypothetical protein